MGLVQTRPKATQKREKKVTDDKCPLCDALCLSSALRSTLCMLVGWCVLWSRTNRIESPICAPERNRLAQNKLRDQKPKSGGSTGQPIRSVWPSISHQGTYQTKDVHVWDVDGLKERDAVCQFCARWDLKWSKDGSGLWFLIWAWKNANAKPRRLSAV